MKLKGSMTVEMSFLMPMIMFLVMGCILAVFYYHDKNVLSGAAYETAVAGSTRMRERDGIDEGELEALYAERTEGKCILFAGSSAQVSVGEKEIVVEATAQKGRFMLSVLKKAAVTDPEKYIRDRRRMKEVIDGATDND
ncbi:TadE family protein [Lachnospiraceae bacterium 50-23]